MKYDKIVYIEYNRTPLGFIMRYEFSDTRMVRIFRWSEFSRAWHLDWAALGWY